MARILFVTKGNVSGPAQSLLNLLPQIRLHHEVEILLSTPGPLEDILIRQGYAVQAIPVRYRTIPSLALLLSRKKIDLVYLNGFTAGHWRALIAAKIARRKIIWHIREILTVNQNHSRNLRRRVRFADHIIAVSEACAASVKTLDVKCPVSVVHNGINFADFQLDFTESKEKLLRMLDLPETSFMIVTVGRIHSMKNQCDAVRAVKILLQSHSNIHLVLVGETQNEYLAQITALIDQTGLNNHIHVLGFRPDVLEILSGCDLCVHPTLAEAHPRAMLEALAAGVPVVAYDVGGVKEALLDGETGFLVPVGNVDELASRMHQLIDDSELRKQFARRGRQIVKTRFSAEQTAQNVLRVIDKVLLGEALN